MKKLLKRTPLYRLWAKLHVIRSYPALSKHPRAAATYLLRDPELTNFTYDIANRDEIAAFVADIASITEETARAFIAEIDEDQSFHAELAEMSGSRPHRKPPLLGRRVGWYALMRALQPALVFETGTSDGLGAAVIGRALQRNGKGRLVTFDIKGWAGWLIPPDLPVDLRVGDSAVTLPEALAVMGPPEVFLHDSDHSYAHEAAELAVVYRPGMLLLSDNAHAETALADFAELQGLRYVFVREQPVGHWYVGGGIGAAVHA